MSIELTKEQNRFLDFLYTFDKEINLLKGNDVQLIKAIKNNPENIVVITNLHEDTDFNVFDKILYSIDPNINLIKAHQFKLNSHFTIQAEIDYGYYQGDETAVTRITFRPYYLFVALDNEKLLDGKLKSYLMKKQTKKKVA